MINLEDLINKQNQQYDFETQQIEIIIDQWIQTWFDSTKKESIPLLIIEMPRKIVKENLTEKYFKGGWNLYFIDIDEPEKIGIKITENI